MILYFSGTGNSKYVAKRITDALGDEIVNLNARIKASDTSSIETGERLIIVMPTYAWRIPRVVRNWLRKTELRGAKQAWFVMTCGSEIGNADKYNRELGAEKAISCMGTAQIVMPENYIAMFPHRRRTKRGKSSPRPNRISTASSRQFRAINRLRRRETISTTAS